MRDVTVTIIARDEADRIAAAVASAGWAAAVVVLDSGSGDGTAAVARAAGARVEVEPWRGYGAQKNRAAELAPTAWVFSLDADERISTELAAAILALPADPGQAAYRVRRRNRFCGRPVRHWPWAWDLPARLYDRQRARFSERSVHETLVTEGAVGRLAGVLEHLGERSLQEYLDRRAAYARLGAEQAAGEGRRSGPLAPAIHAAATFVRLAMVRGELLGGALGLRHALLAARGSALKYRYLREIGLARGAGVRGSKPAGPSGPPGRPG